MTAAPETPPAPAPKKQMNVTALPDYLREQIEVAPTGCWLWTGDNTEGYGRAYIPRSDGRKGRQQRAHRAVWEVLVGVPTPGLVFDHLCRVTLCVRPRHLEEVTQQENMRRSAVNGGVLYVPRPKPLACKYGHVYDEANTRVVKNGVSAGCYECRTCQRLRRWWNEAKAWEATHHVAA